MSNQQIEDKIKFLQKIFKTLEDKEIHVQNAYGILAYMTMEPSCEMWWLDDGSCIEVFKVRYGVSRAVKMPAFNIFI